MEEERHFENAVRWINDLTNTKWLAAPEFPMTRLKEQEWFEVRCRAGHDEANWAIESLDGEHIGFSNLFRIDFMHGTAISGSMIGDASYRGKGYGSDAARVRANFAFECLGLQTLYSSYFEENDGSARMQAAAGYEIWGRQPNAMWKRGAHRTMVHTFLTKERFELLQGV